MLVSSRPIPVRRRSEKYVILGSKYAHWIGLYLSFHLNWVLGPFVHGRLQNLQTSEVTFAHAITPLSIKLYCVNKIQGVCVWEHYHWPPFLFMMVFSRFHQPPLRSVAAVVRLPLQPSLVLPGFPCLVANLTSLWLRWFPWLFNV